MGNKREPYGGLLIAVAVLDSITFEIGSGTVGIAVAVAMREVRKVAWFVGHNIPERKFGMVKGSCVPYSLAFRWADSNLLLDFAWDTAKMRVSEELT